MDEAFDLAVIVDDDPDIALAARLALRDLFKEIATLPSPKDLRAFIKSRSPDAILLDLNFERAATDGSEGLDYLGRIMTEDPEAAVVIITAHSAVSVAVEAIKRGASDFVAKPWSNERLAATVRSAAALRRTKLKARLEQVCHDRVVGRNLVVAKAIEHYLDFLERSDRQLPTRDRL